MFYSSMGTDLLAAPSQAIVPGNITCLDLISYISLCMDGWVGVCVWGCEGGWKCLLLWGVCSSKAPFPHGLMNYTCKRRQHVACACQRPSPLLQEMLLRLGAHAQLYGLPRVSPIQCECRILAQIQISQRRKSKGGTVKSAQHFPLEGARSLRVIHHPQGTINMCGFGVRARSPQTIQSLTFIVSLELVSSRSHSGTKAGFAEPMGFKKCCWPRDRTPPAGNGG